MERCKQHQLLNCKCTENLSAYLARQFREATSEGIRMDRRELEPDRDQLGDMGDRVFVGRVLGGGTKK